MSDNIFPYLVIGLAKYLERGMTYPYPDELLFSLNHIFWANKDTFPKTLSGFLKLTNSPLSQWYKLELPQNFDPEAPLTDSNDLSANAQEYLDTLLDETNLPKGASLEDLQLALDNHKFFQLIKRLRAAFPNSPQRVQKEYVLLRRFLIENPITSLEKIEFTFERCQYLQVEEIVDFYDSVERVQHKFAYPDTNGQAKLWSCLNCGPLSPKQNELQSAKSSSCSSTCPRHVGGWLSHEINPQLVVLKRAIHLRALIPGIAELNLFDWLVELMTNNAEFIADVQLYPNVDAYDIYLRFADATVWALDIKDYKDPYQLANQLKGIYNQGDLKYQRGFYVYPAVRNQQHQGYRDIVLENSKRKRKGASIRTDEEFQIEVLKMLESMKG